MAEFIRATGSDLTPIVHGKEIFKNYLKQMSLQGLFGKPGSGSPIIVDDTLKGQPGDKIRYHFIPQDESAGIAGQNATILGNETSLDEYSFDLSIDQLAKAYRKKGKMTDQRTIWKFRNEAKLQLQNWWAQKSEDLLFQAMTGQLSGMTYTWTATTDAVTGDHRCIRADGANSFAEVTAANSDDTALAAAMNAGDTMSPQLIDEAVILARQGGTYKIRPTKVGPNGEEFFVLFLSLRCAKALRYHPDWLNHAYSIADRGLSDDMIANGALGVWNNVIVKASERVIDFTVSAKTYARNLLLGADAAVLGWAQTLQYSEELVDHDRILSIAADEIRGQTKVLYNTSASATEDAGIVQVIAASM